MKTNLEVLNEISAKLEGQDNATSITEALNNIANALGDNNPDKIISVSNSLEDILSVAGQGGGGSSLTPVLSVKIVNNAENTCYVAGGKIVDGSLITYYPLGSVEPSETKVFNSIVEGYYDSLSEETWFSYSTMNYISGELISVYSASDMVNCTGNSGEVVITDPTLSASVTFTIGDQGQ